MQLVRRVCHTGAPLSDRCRDDHRNFAFARDQASSQSCEGRGLHQLLFRVWPPESSVPRLLHLGCPSRPLASGIVPLYYPQGNGRDSDHAATSVAGGKQEEDDVRRQRHGLVSRRINPQITVSIRVPMRGSQCLAPPTRPLPLSPTACAIVLPFIVVCSSLLAFVGARGLGAIAQTGNSTLLTFA